MPRESRVPKEPREPRCPGNLGCPGCPGCPGCVPVCGEWCSFTFSSTFPTKVSSFGMAHVSPKMAMVKTDAMGLYGLISIRPEYIHYNLSAMLLGCLLLSNPQPYATRQCFTLIAGFVPWKHLERTLLQTMQLSGESRRESQVRVLLHICCRNGSSRCPLWFKAGKAFWVTT